MANTWNHFDVNAHSVAELVSEIDLQLEERKRRLGLAEAPTPSYEETSDEQSAAMDE